MARSRYNPVARPYLPERDERIDPWEAGEMDTRRWATPKQLRLIRRHGVTPPAGLDTRQASALIAKLIAGTHA